MGTQAERDGPAGRLDPSAISSTQELAAALTALRQRAGVSIRRLASVTGVPSATLGGYFSGRHLPSVSQGSAFQDVLAALGVTDDEEVDAWLEAVRRLRARPSAERRPNPYRGLRAFTEDDADRFFGREGYVDDVLGLLRDQTSTGPGMVVVVAPSGAGKSSLLRGGVVPALRSADPPVVVSVMVPGADPLAALDVALQARSGDEPARVLVVDQLEEVFSAGVTEDARRDFLARLAGLAEVQPDGSRSAVVLGGIRADFYGQALREPVLLPALQQAQVVLGPMCAEELRRAIVEPPRVAGASVEEELVELLLRELAPRGVREGDAAHRSGALPLLSHALMAAWERHTGDRMTVGDYLSTGGIAGAVQASAEDAYQSLSPQGKHVARQLFSRLVNVDDEGVLTRRRAPHTELAGLDHVAEVLERFIAARLLTATDTTIEVSHEALLEAWPRLGGWIDEDRDVLRARRRVAGAASAWEEQGRDDALLLRGGPLATALDLLDDERALLTPQEKEFVERSRVSEAADLAAQRRRSRRLAQLLAAMTVLAVLAGLLAFLALDSRNEAQEQRAVADRARDAALSRQVATDADRIMGNDLGLGKLLAAAAYDISPTRKARSTLLDAASLRQVTRFVGPDGSMHAAVAPDRSLLAFSGADGSVRLWVREDDGGYRRTAVATGDPEGGLLFASAFSPDQRTLAVGGINGTVMLLDVADPAAPREIALLEGPETAVQALAFSPDGEALVAATSDPALHRWRVSGDDDVEPLPTVTGFDASVQSVAYSPDGRIVATGSNDARLRLWQVGAGRELRLLSEQQLGLPTNAVLSVAVSPDGRTLAAGAKDKAVRLFDITDPGRPRALDGPATEFDSFVNSVAFSSDGDLLAAGSPDGTARVWDVSSGEEVTRIPLPSNVTTVAFTGDSTGLVTGSLDGTGRLWSLEERGVGGLGDNIWSVAYDEAGSRLLVGAGTGDGAVHVYDVEAGDVTRPRAELRAPEDAGTLDGSAALSTDGSLVAGGTASGHVVLWRESGAGYEQVVVLAPSTQLIEVVAFSDDGRLLASIGDDGVVAVWEVDALLAGEEPESALVAEEQVGTIPLGLGFSPDASLLAVGAADNRVHLWRLDEAGAVVETLEPLGGFDNYAIGVDFSTDGRLLAAGGADGTVRVWDVSDPAAVEPVGRTAGPTDQVYSVAWQPDGTVLAGASMDGAVWLWDLAEPGRPRPLANLLALPGDVYSVTFSPDGSQVAGAGSNRSVRVWDVEPAVAVERICSASGTRLRRAEWSRYVPGAPYTPPCV